MLPYDLLFNPAALLTVDVLHWAYKVALVANLPSPSSYQCYSERKMLTNSTYTASAARHALLRVAWLAVRLLG